MGHLAAFAVLNVVASSRGMRERARVHERMRFLRTSCYARRPADDLCARNNINELWQLASANIRVLKVVVRRDR